MKNLRIKSKLIIAFIAVAILAAIAGIFGVAGLNTLNKNEEKMYGQAIVANDAERLWRNIISQRAAYRGAALKYYMGTEYETDIAELNTLQDEFSELLVDLQTRLSLPENKTRLSDTLKAYEEYKGYQSSFIAAIKADNKAGMTEPFNKMAPLIETMIVNLQAVSESAIDVVDTTNVTDSETATFLMIFMIALAALAVSSAVFFAFYISGMISKPLVILTSFMKQAGSTGDITLRPEDLENINKYSQNKDETGQCIASTAGFVKHLTTIAGELGTIADGDLTTEVDVLSERDIMGVAMQKMADSLNGMFSEIQASTTQVSTGSRLIADGAQSLAQGSTQQASAIEELSASISEIAEQTKQNVNIAKEAAALSGTIKSNAEKGSEQMDQMMHAVREINEASNQISKVIKVIDDIAFQTNILALNAAVEAARAGQHGKGFAVVAEEVRSLAAKSAEAAKDTGGLIENSIEKANLGFNIATETSTSLKEIVEGINRSAEIVAQIARSSDEQAGSIAQINTGIDQVAQVVQQNSATAEESAAASEEMSGQSDMLEQLIAQFKLRDSALSHSLNDPSRKKALTMPRENAFSLSGRNREYGKY